MSTRFLLGELDINNRITNLLSRISVKGAGTAITGRGVMIEDVV